VDVHTVKAMLTYLSFIGHVTTIKSQSSSGLGLHSFMPECELRLPTWIKASSPKGHKRIEPPTKQCSNQALT
jgi:hypothetical protein